MSAEQYSGYAPVQKVLAGPKVLQRGLATTVATVLEQESVFIY